MADALPQLIWISTPEGRTYYLNTRRDEFSYLIMDDSGCWDWHFTVHQDDIVESDISRRKAITHVTENKVEHRFTQMEMDRAAGN